MEDWEVEFQWLQVRHRVKDILGNDKLPDLNAVLMMIGIQELGKIKKFSKDEKQDLMHIGVCTLMQADGYFEFEEHDEEGWPHFKAVKKFETTGEKAQERYLIEKTISYFQEIDQHTGG
ncbi:MAG: hypothetical protein RL757_1044 [Bacteroidota bacterium]